MDTVNDELCVKAGDTVSLDGCNGTWFVIGVGARVKVQPENLLEDPIWVDFGNITGVR